MKTRSLAVSAVLTLAALTGCSDTSTTAEDPNPAGSTTSATGQPSHTGAPAPTDGSPSSADTVTVPLYFVGETPAGPRLYREFRAVEADNPLEEAAALVTAGDALDPDYGTIFPGGSFASVQYSEAAGAFIVEVTDEGWATPGPGMTAAEAELAVQQLVYTLQGVQQTRAPVVVQLAGSPTTLFGIDSADGITNAPQLDVLALVNVTAPAQGAAVSGTFTASGVASSFEANVLWEIRQGDEVVRHGFAMAEGWMDKLYPWETEIDVSDLAPGQYTFVALTDDPSDGEGEGPTEDSKTITVE